MSRANVFLTFACIVVIFGVCWSAAIMLQGNEERAERQWRSALDRQDAEARRLAEEGRVADERRAEIEKEALALEKRHAQKRLDLSEFLGKGSGLDLATIFVDSYYEEVAKDGSKKEFDSRAWQKRYRASPQYQEDLRITRRRR